MSSRLRLARYLVKPPVSLDRLNYDPTTCTVVYVSSKRNERRTMSGLDYLAELSQHIPDRGIQCPECGATLCVIAAITDVLVAEKILKHLGLLQRPRPPNVHRCPSALASSALGRWPSADDEDNGDGDASAEFTDVGSCNDGDQAPNDDWPVDPPFPED